MKTKFEDLCKKNWIWSVAAFGIPFIISVIICAAAGIYPFGDNCILHIDMYHQYCPFFMEFQDKLKEGGSLLFSWNLGLGTDFFATYIYYLASPLNWLLFLCPRGLVIEFMTLTIWAKIALAGLFFFLFLKEKYNLIGKDGRYHASTAAPALVFSTAYAFSGFVATYSWNIMWMDSIALAPLIVLGLERLVKKNRPALYYVSLALSIFCNYYISMIICIFLVIYFGLLFLEQKKGKLMACVRFAWYSLLAGGTGTIFLIPEAKILSYSSSSGNSWPEAMEWYFGIVEELSRLCVVAEPYTGNNYWPNLYCGVFTVLLVCMYVLNTRIKWSEKIPRILVLILFMISFANNYLDLIWHGLRFPRSLPARQSFLFIFMMLMIGFETYRKRKGNKVWHVLLSMFVCLVGLVASYGKADFEVTGEIAFILTGIFLLAYGLCFLIHHFGDRKIRATIRGFAFGLAMGEVFLNMAVTGFYSLDRTAYLSKMNDYEHLIELAESDARAEAEDGTTIFYRIEDTERKTKNDSALYGYPSGTIFSTIMDISVSHFYQSVYMEGGANYYCYNGATPILSSMLSVKYSMSDNPDGTNALRTLVGNSGEYYLYENKYCLPLGFIMSEDAVEEWKDDVSGKTANINALATALGANTALLSMASVEMETNPGETVIRVYEDGLYYGYYSSCNTNNLNISINGGEGVQYGKTTHRYLFELGDCKAGDVIRISNNAGEAVRFTVLKMNMDALDTAYETLCQQTMVTESYSDTQIKGHIQVEEAGRLIFSIPSEEGWTLYVDGKETEMTAFKDTFLSVHLDEGYHTIELKYMTPGLITGAIITSACVALFCATMFVRRWVARKNASNEATGNLG